MTATPELPLPKKVQAHDLVAAVKFRHAPPEWCVEEEMTLGDRRLDVVAFNLWGGSRQYRVLGFEVKVSRGDWLRELADFQKSAEWTRVVDSFYVVTPPKVILTSELPKGWGHLELVGNRMMTRAHATNRTPGAMLPREIVARFMTRNIEKVQAMIRHSESTTYIKVRAEVEEAFKKSHANDRAKDLKDLNELRDQRKALLSALGVDPQGWDAHRHAMQAAGVFASYQRDATSIAAAVKRAAQMTKGHYEAMEEAVKTLEKAS